MVDRKDLIAAGWTRRSVDCDPRLSEAVRMYQGLGQEVLLVPVLEECAAAGPEDGCTACFSDAASPDRYRVIYTRPRPGAKDEGESLF